MTVEADLFNALKALVANRAFPDVAPAGTVRPYITYQQAGGESVVFMERAAASMKNGRFQVNVWADTRGSAAALALQIENTLIAATTMQATPLGSPVGAYEEDTNLFGTRQDFSIWSNR